MQPGYIITHFLPHTVYKYLTVCNYKTVNEIKSFSSNVKPPRRDYAVGIWHIKRKVTLNREY